VNTKHNAIVAIGIDDLGTLLARRSMDLHAVAGRIPPLGLPPPSSVLVLLYSDDQPITDHLRSDLLIVFRANILLERQLTRTRIGVGTLSEFISRLLFIASDYPYQVLCYQAA